MTKTLRLPSSPVKFENSNLITDIHQSLIDLESNPPNKEVQKLILKSISFLDHNLDINTSNELFSLIQSCFSHYPDVEIKNIEFNVDINVIKNTLNYFTVSDLKSSVWNYLSNFDIYLPNELAEKVTDFPNPVAAVKIMPHPEDLPQDVIDRCLLEASDLTVYNRLFHIQLLSSQVFTTKNFWLHLVTVISNSKSECDVFIIQKSSELMQTCVKKEKFIEIFNSMLFIQYPPSEKVSSFLFKIFRDLEYQYRKFYTDSENMEYLVQKIIEKKQIPIPSFCLILDFLSLSSFLRKNQTNAIVLYLYEFSYMREYAYQLESITIQQLDNTSLNDIFNFINNYELNNIVNMNENSLYFIVSAFIFTSNKEKVTINGLTKETILPFIAICFNYLNRSKGNLLYMPANMSDLLCNSFVSMKNNHSKIKIASIDTIISFYEYLLSDLHFHRKFAYEIIDIIFSIFIENAYKADKELFVIMVFGISDRVKNNSQLSKIYTKYGIDFIKYIINKLHGLSGFKKLDDFGLKLNLNAFDSYKVGTLIENFVSNSSSNEKVFYSIRFIQKYCVNSPNIFISNPNKIGQILKDKINNKEWDDFSLISQFLVENEHEYILQPFYKESIPYSIKNKLIKIDSIDNINDLITSILTINQPENFDTPFQQLFYLLMTEKSIATDYITVLLEKLGKSKTIESKEILKIYIIEFISYKKAFINALHRSFYFHPIAESFVRKATFKSITFPQSQLAQSVINFLFKKAAKIADKGSYQAFFILKNIAASFPFLFVQNPQNIFDVVLPSLDYFILYYSIRNNKESKVTLHNLKVAITSLSFLFSTLYSTTVLDAFVPWFFTSINNFSESQFLSFVFIFISLFQTKKVKIVILSLSMKYHLIKSLISRLKMDISSELVGFYEPMIYTLITKYYDTLNGLSKNKIIFVDEIHKVKNPFTFAFNNFSTIFPYQLVPLNIPSPRENKIINQFNDFIKLVNKVRPFWLTYDFIGERNDTYDISNITDLESEIELLQQPFSDIDELPSIPYIRTIKAIRYLTTQPN